MSKEIDEVIKSRHRILKSNPKIYLIAVCLWFVAAVIGTFTNGFHVAALYAGMFAATIALYCMEKQQKLNLELIERLLALEKHTGKNGKIGLAVAQK